MSAVNTLSRLAATFFGAGYSPLVPGTVGSAAALPLYLAIRRLSLPCYLAVAGVITLIGIFASDAMEKVWGKDPSKVVIDEVAGMLITLSARPKNLRDIFIGFVLFRLFDIIKPPPVRNLEALPGGVGIMADDVAAGILAATVLSLIRAAMNKGA